MSSVACMEDMYIKDHESCEINRIHVKQTVFCLGRSEEVVDT